MAKSVVETLIIEIAGDSKKFKQELNALKKANKDGESSFKKFAMAGKAAFLAVGAAATVMAVESTKAFISFEKGVTNVAKTTNLAGQDLEDFKKEIMDLSEEIPATTDQLLEIATAAGQLGIKGTKNLTIFTETIAKLGATTDLEGEQAAISIARILNLTNEGTETVDQFGAAIVDLGNNFATSESQILEVAKEVAKATVNFKLSSPQILGMSAAMSALGIQAEAGATVVAKAFLKIDKVIRSKAGPQFEKLMELTGMTGDQLEKTFKDDASLVFQSFIEGLGEAGKSGKSMVGELEELGLTGIRVNKILPTLASRSDILTDAFNRSSTAYRDNIALNKEAAIAFDITASKLTIAGNKLNNLAITFGEKIAPALIAAIDAISNTLTDTLAEEIVRATDGFGNMAKGADAFQEELKKVQSELDKLAQSAKNSFGKQKEVSDQIIKTQEEAAKKRKAIAISNAAELKKANDAIIDSLKTVRQAFEDIDYVSTGEVFKPYETAVGDLKTAFDKLNVSAQAFADIDYNPPGKGNPSGGDRGPGDDFAVDFDFGDPSAAAENFGKGIASQITGVSGAMAGFQQGGPAGAIAGFAAEILLSNEEFMEVIGEINEIIAETFAPIIHEMIPTLKIISRVMKKISPSIQKMAPAIEAIGKVIVFLFNAIEKTQERLQEVFQALEALREPAVVMAGGMKELQTAINELTAPLDELRHSIDSLVSPIEDLTSALSGGGAGGAAGGIISSIVSTAGFSTGGIVPGSGSGDIVPAMLEPGELVVPKNLTSSLLDISAGFGNIQIPAASNQGGGGGSGEKRIVVELTMNDNAAEVINAQIREGNELGYMNRN